MSRTFKITKPLVEGPDVATWQQDLNAQMKVWRVDYQLKVDGKYAQVTREMTATVCHGLGLASAASAMKDGVTHELRSKLRNKRLTLSEKARFKARAKWRAELRKRHASSDVSPPLGKILQSSWGFHPPVHDGVDLICNPRAAGLAICKAKVIRADNGGWWGKGAPSPAVAAKGDGILVLRCLVNVGPFKPGLNFCYGHAEHMRVKVGETVQAGQVVCEAGMANAWHFHFMVNGRTDDRGVGDRDPMKFINYTLKS